MHGMKLGEYADDEMSGRATYPQCFKAKCMAAMKIPGKKRQKIIVANRSTTRFIGGKKNQNFQ